DVELRAARRAVPVHLVEAHDLEARGELPAEERSEAARGPGDEHLAGGRRRRLPAVDRFEPHAARVARALRVLAARRLSALRAQVKIPWRCASPSRTSAWTRARTSSAFLRAASSGSSGSPSSLIGSSMMMRSFVGSGSAPSGPSHGKNGVTGSEGSLKSLAIGFASQ